MLQPLAGPRAAVGRSAAAFASDDFFLWGVIAAPRTQLPHGSMPSLLGISTRTQGAQWSVTAVAAQHPAAGNAAGCSERCVSINGAAAAATGGSH